MTLHYRFLWLFLPILIGCDKDDDSPISTDIIQTPPYLAEEFSYPRFSPAYEVDANARFEFKIHEYDSTLVSELGVIYLAADVERGTLNSLDFSHAAKGKSSFRLLLSLLHGFGRDNGILQIYLWE